jgi:hypothetical protein
MPKHYTDADFRAAQENYYKRYYQPRQPYGATDTWCAWKILDSLFHAVATVMFWAAAVVIGAVAFPSYYLLLGLFPDADPDTLGCLAFGLGALCFVWMLVRVFRSIRRSRRERFIERYRPRPQNEIFAAIGMCPNPPEPWFSPSGEALYERTLEGWRLKTLPQLGSPR